MNTNIDRGKPDQFCGSLPWNQLVQGSPVVLMNWHEERLNTLFPGQLSLQLHSACGTVHEYLTPPPPPPTPPTEHASKSPSVAHTVPKAGQGSAILLRKGCHRLIGEGVIMAAFASNQRSKDDVIDDLLTSF